MTPARKTVGNIRFKLEDKGTPKIAAATARIIVLKSPERINAVSKNVTKKMSAVPKSPIRAKRPTQTAEKIMYSSRFFFVINTSSELAPIKMKIIFASSDG